MGCGQWMFCLDRQRDGVGTHKVCLGGLGELLFSGGSYARVWEEVSMVLLDRIVCQVRQEPRRRVLGAACTYRARWCQSGPG